MSKFMHFNIPLFEQVCSLKSKLNLVDADRKAYYDATFQKLTGEHEKLLEIRAEVKELRQKMHEKLNTEEYIIEQALQRQPKDRQALSKFPAFKAIDMLDDQVSNKMKRLNALRYKTIEKRNLIHDLEEKYAQCLLDVGQLEELINRKGKAGQMIREIENRLDKAVLKQSEATHVNATYLKIKNLLKVEAKSYNLTLDAIEKEITASRSELKQLKEVFSDVDVAKDHELVELRRHEEFVSTEMKRRELELTNMKKLADSKEHQNISSKAAVPIEMEFAELKGDGSADKENDDMEEIDENAIKLKRHEEVFQTIKESTGLSDLTQMVKRFQSQVNTFNSLNALKTQCEEQIATLNEEKLQMTHDLINVKYFSEDKLSKHLQVKTEREIKMIDLKNSIIEIIPKVEEKKILLSKIRFGLEHLAIKCDKKIDKNVDILDVKPFIKLLEKINNELTLYIGEMKEYDLFEELIKLKDEQEGIILMPSEFAVSLESRVNTFNTRIKMAHDKENQLKDSDSETDEKSLGITRESLLKQSKRIVEAKAKKRAATATL